VRRFQSAEAGANDDHAMGCCGPRLLGRHGERLKVSDVSGRTMDM
jgi:hypothetical protein